jgi:DNA repair protein RadA/Sms
VDVAPISIAFSCSGCNAVFKRWLGRCPHCAAVGTIRALGGAMVTPPAIIGAMPLAVSVSPIARAIAQATAPPSARDYAPDPDDADEPGNEPIPITEVPEESYRRISTGLAPFDRVLGGGLVVGSLVLLGGDPGAGKSSLAVQLAANVTIGTVLYASGEESPGQVAERARRLESAKPHIQIVHENRIDRIVALAERLRASLVIVDSIHTLWAPDISGVQGSVTQVRACTARLMDFAKGTGTTTIAIGHITKDGGLAGPKTLEHLVDATLLLSPYADGEITETAYRILRAFKNRFGATTETGALEMRANGLVEAFGLPDYETTEGIVPVAQEILNRYRRLGGDVDDGLRDRIAGRLECDQEIAR